MPVKFDSKAINECLGLDYQGLAFEKNYEKWGKKEMEKVKKNITVPGTKWEPCTINEFKVKRGSLTHDAMVWFNFVKQTILPTSHATNVEKERMMLLDVILGGKDVDVGRLISREITLCHSKTAGYLFYPCLITNLCVAAGVEMKGEEKGYPVSAFPIVLKTKKVAAASGDPTMLPQLVLQQRAMWEFQRKQHEWLVASLAANLKEPVDVEVPVFPEWILEEEECMEDVLFEGELNGEEEVEVQKETVAGGRKRKRKEIKKG